MISFTLHLYLLKSIVLRDFVSDAATKLLSSPSTGQSSGSKIVEREIYHLL